MIRRGEVWWASLPAPPRSEPGYRRPVLVVQSDDFNRSAIGTVVIVAITSNTRLAGAPGNVLLSRRDTRLRRDSVANVSQMLTVDKTFLVERVSVLPTRVRERVEAGLRLVLSL
ncbi:MAG TPA: type II toxin-antitoxin system PemK/MazF family toxin [Polyangia bacterium]|nr:type II toxin-antitoxin system PemK/MazF family toxin [Polyangia bacterium]